MKYELLALDVDGTLAGPDSKVSPEVIDAVAEAQRAGLRVCIATGRSFIETIPVWRQLRLRPPYDPMVLIGGALVAEPHTGRTLWQRVISPVLAAEYSDELLRAGHSAIAIVDAWRWGFDYYIAEGPDAETVHRRWFAQMNVQVRRVARLAPAESDPPPLRINAVVEPAAAPALAERLARQFDGRLNVHSILAPNYGVTIVEAFSREASKWSAIRYVAQTDRIAPARMIAVGDDVNDLPMIRGAGLGVAMPGAPETVRAEADRVAEGGLAKFLHDLLAGA